MRALSREHDLGIEDSLLESIADAMAARGRTDPDLPGQVYERRLASDRSGRRAGGAYYTPGYLVDFVIDRAVRPLLDTLTPADLGRIRVVDPSCGGGVFLTAALRAGVPNTALYGIDRDPVAVAVCRLGLILAGADDARVVCADALLHELPDHDERYDLVIGNPPWGQKGFRFEADEARALRDRYRCASGVLDPFKLFIERAHQLLRPGGRWAMVLPDIVLLKNQQPVRDLILEQASLEWIAHAGRAFAGVNLDTVVVVAALDPAPAAHEVSIWHELPAQWRESPPATHRLAQSVFGELPGHKFNIHLDEASLEVLHNLDALPRFGDAFEIHEGVHSGNARAKLFLDHCANEHCRELIVGRGEIAPFRLTWRGAWIDLAPGALDRPGGDYANAGRPEWHLRPKIVVRRTGDRVIAAVDEYGYYCSNNLFVVIPRVDTSIEMLRAHVALLNSAFMTWYFRTIQPRTGRLFAELKIQHLASFPIPEGVEQLAGYTGQCASLDDSVDRLLGLTDPPYSAAS